MVSFANTSSYPRAMMIHSLDANPALITMASSIGPINITSRAQLNPIYHLFLRYHIRYNGIVIYMLTLGNMHKLLVYFIPIFLNINRITIF